MELILIVLCIHYVADFVLQTTWMATNKSKHMKPLLAHIGVYTLVMLIIGPMYAIVNGMTHMCVDYISSRILSHFWKKKNRRAFFAVLGLDQLLHQVCLILTLPISSPLWLCSYCILG